MLVLSRKLNEAIVIDGGIRIRVVGLRGNQVRLGIEAPDQVKVFREELCAGSDTPATTANGEARTASRRAPAEGRRRLSSGRTAPGGPPHAPFPLGMPR